MPNIISNVAVHDSGGKGNDSFASSRDLTMTQISNAHQARWPDFPSRLLPNVYVGYNFIVFPSGAWVQTRYVGEETAAQKGSNKDTVSICLTGNFTIGVEKPTPQQETTLAGLITALIDKDFDGAYKISVLPGTIVNIPINNIHPHRFYQVGTSCYGSYLSDSWAKNLVLPLYISRLQILIQNLKDRIAQLISQKKFGGSMRCSEIELRD